MDLATNEQRNKSIKGSTSDSSSLCRMNQLCDICNLELPYKTAEYECHECGQCFCSPCNESHRLFNGTKYHTVTSLANTAPLKVKDGPVFPAKKEKKLIDKSTPRKPIKRICSSKFTGKLSDPADLETGHIEKQENTVQDAILTPPFTPKREKKLIDLSSPKKAFQRGGQYVFTGTLDDPIDSKVEPTGRQGNRHQDAILPPLCPIGKENGLINKSPPRKPHQQGGQSTFSGTFLAPIDLETKHTEEQEKSPWRAQQTPSLAIKKEDTSTKTPRSKPDVQREYQLPVFRNSPEASGKTNQKQGNTTDFRNVFKTKIVEDGRSVLARSIPTQPNNIYTAKSRKSMPDFTIPKENKVEIPPFNSMEGGDELEISVKESDFLEVTFHQRKTKPRKPPFTKFHTKYFTDEHEPIITSMNCMLDGRIVLVDVKNRKLKLYRSTYDFQMEREIPEGPYGVAPVNETKVAVTTTVRPLIKFYEFDDTIVKESKDYFKLNLYGIGYGISFSKGKYAVLCNKLGNTKTYSTIRILDNHGNQILIIDCKGMFHCALKADTLVLHDERIFVLNQSETIPENKVLCVVFNGHSAEVVWGRSLGCAPVAIGLGESGLLLACRSADDTECQIKEMRLTGEGEIKTIIKEKYGILSPRYVACQRLENRLIVAEVSRSEVTVFNLTK